MFNYPNVQLEMVDREIDRFIDNLKSDGFDFAAAQHCVGEGTSTEALQVSLGGEESRDFRS